MTTNQATAFMQVYSTVDSSGKGTPWDGDATHPAYVGKWSNVRYMQIPVAQEIGSAESADVSRSVGRAEFADLTIIKDTDQMTPKLFSICASGKELSLVVLEYAMYQGSKASEYSTPRYVVFLQGVKFVEFEIDEHRFHRRDFELTTDDSKVEGPELLHVPTGTHGQNYEDAIASSIDKMKCSYDQISISVYDTLTPESGGGNYGSGKLLTHSGWDRMHNVPFDFPPGTPHSGTSSPRVWLASS